MLQHLRTLAAVAMVAVFSLSSGCSWMVKRAAKDVAAHEKEKFTEATNISDTKEELKEKIKKTREECDLKQKDLEKKMEQELQECKKKQDDLKEQIKKLKEEYDQKEKELQKKLEGK